MIKICTTTFTVASACISSVVRRPFMIIFLNLAILTSQATHAQELTPTGQRLKTLATNAGIQFGYAARDEFNDHVEEEKHDEIVIGEFDILTPENALKWRFLRPQQDVYDFANMDDLIAFSETNNMDIHGHPLLWHRINPDWLDTLDLADVEADMINHINTVVSKYAGKIKIWDVVNEGLEDTINGGGVRQNIWARAMGGSYIKDAFTLARAADPDAQLIYNEYGVIGINPKSDEMYAMVSEMIDEGVPIDGIGLQMHLKSDFDGYDNLSANMQRFADLDLDIYISELDVQVQEVEDYDLQADIYAKVVERCLLQPRCKAIQVWGVSDYYSFLPWFDPLMFDDDWQAKPAYFSVQKTLTSTYLHTEQASEGVGTLLSAGAIVADPQTTEQRWFKLDQVDLSPGYASAKLRFRNSGPDATTITVHSGSPSGPELAVFPLDAGNAAFRDVSVELAAGTSIEDLFFLFGDNSQCVAVDAMTLLEPTSDSLPVIQTDVTSGVTSSAVGDDELIATCNDSIDGTTDDGTTDNGTTDDGTTDTGNSSGGGGGTVLLIPLLLTGFLSLRIRRRFARIDLNGSVREI